MARRTESERRRFGEALARLRTSCGLTQETVCERLSDYYSDPRAYRRVEAGERTPDRRVAIAIHAVGFEILDPEVINANLALAGYLELTAAEIEEFGLKTPGSAQPDAERPHPPSSTLSRMSVWVSAVVITATLVVDIGFALFGPYPPWLAVAINLLYGSLYLISLQLESAYEPRRRSLAAGTLVFALMAGTAGAGIGLDSLLVRNGPALAFGAALTLFAAAAILQWWIAAQFVLPDYPIVKTTFRSHTAQAAHLKNTGFFLLIAVFFLVPPAHTISVLRIGHPGIYTRDRVFIAGPGFVSLDVWGMVAVFVLMILISIPMGSRLMDSLRDSPHLSEYQRLFYLRALIYFLLAAVCLGWFAEQSASLPSAAA